jgi:hypothetical protein
VTALLLPIVGRRMQDAEVRCGRVVEQLRHVVVGVRVRVGSTRRVRIGLLDLETDEMIGGLISQGIDAGDGGTLVPVRPGANPGGRSRCRGRSPPHRCRSRSGVPPCRRSARAGGRAARRALGPNRPPGEAIPGPIARWPGQGLDCPFASGAGWAVDAPQFFVRIRCARSPRNPPTSTAPGT